MSTFLKYKYCRAKSILFFLTSLAMLCCLFTGCQNQTEEGQNQAFRKFTNEIFCQETASNTISLHYTLKNPEKYGIKEIPVTYGALETGKQDTLASIENIRRAMNKFDYEKLSAQNQLTYDVLEYDLGCLEDDAEYTLYAEPLGLVSGIHTQLPVVLSEYQFYEKKDVDIYLELLKKTPEYFQSVIEFEEAKSDAGLFMSERAAQQVMEQCQTFMEMGQDNYLISTFVERIDQVKELTEKEKSTYIQRNALMLGSYVLPAYSSLSAAVQKLMKTGCNEQGLCYLPEGKEYYEQSVRFATGSERSVLEMKELTQRQIVEDLEAMERILGIAAGAGQGGTAGAGQEGNVGAGQGGTAGARQEGNVGAGQEKVEEDGQVTQVDVNVSQKAASLIGNPEKAHEAAAMDMANPVSILNGLKKEISNAFPMAPDTTVSVKYVPEALQGQLSPAFYMIPAIDSYEQNVIYVNQAHMGNALTLFTTLAHEGFPGHLYQTVYYAGTNPDPVRSMFSIGGYIEGWATYAEMCSYYLAPITKEQSTILQKNSSIILGLYTLTDIGIHYEGWSREDTMAFLSNYGIQDMKTVDRIYDLVLGSPGNYAKYYIGYVEFLELKKAYAAEKGTEFSQKEFHENVLRAGPAPFKLVDKYMGKLIEK